MDGGALLASVQRNPPGVFCSDRLSGLGTGATLALWGHLRMALPLLIAGRGYASLV